jgi:hypothetical protein
MPSPGRSQKVIINKGSYPFLLCLQTTVTKWPELYVLRNNFVRVILITTFKEGVGEKRERSEKVRQRVV